jgi:hypothetical protein
MLVLADRQVTKTTSSTRFTRRSVYSSKGRPRPAQRFVSLRRLLHFVCLELLARLLQSCKEDDELWSFDLRVQGVVASESSVTGIWEGFLKG